MAYLLWACIFSIFDIPFEHVAYLLSVCIFFLIAHSINNMERMIMKQSRSFYFMDGWWIMLIPSVGILHTKWACTGPWSQSMKRPLLGSHNLKKLNKVTSSIWMKFCNTTHMALVGIYHNWGTCLYFILQNLKLQTSSFS